jgi:hypothetical protein
MKKLAHRPHRGKRRSIPKIGVCANVWCAFDGRCTCAPPAEVLLAEWQRGRAREAVTSKTGRRTNA